MSDQTRSILWGRSAGHCEFDGCPRLTGESDVTHDAVIVGDNAHIIGFSEDGPRGEAELSEALCQDIDNLMLLCKICHKTIDADKLTKKYTVEILKKMKMEHEHKIRMAARLTTDKKSTVVFYGENIGLHKSPLKFEQAIAAMFPNWYPTTDKPIEIGLSNSSFRDNDPSFWSVSSQQLDNMVNQHIKAQIANGYIQHLSLFGIAPQPLLMRLGFLLSDLVPVETYQLHREPNQLRRQPNPGWKWQDDPEVFQIEKPKEIKGSPALILSLSSSIVNSRIYRVLGENATIWRVYIQNPHNDFLKSKNQLQNFRKLMRSLMDEIKLAHGERSEIHLFPSVPVAIAIEFGRIIMPKADLPVIIYDENKSLGGFIRALTLDASNRL